MGWSYGIGVKYKLSVEKNDKILQPNKGFDVPFDLNTGFSLFVDYEKLYHTSAGPSLDGLNFGVVYDY